MSERWLLLSDGARPTEDIYFLESAAPHLRSLGHDVGRLDVRGWRGLFGKMIAGRLVGVNLLICRTLPVGWMNWLERHRAQFGRIVYLIDDDLKAAGDDVTLPEAYQLRMANAAAHQGRLLALADQVVACSPALAVRLRERHASVSVLTPPLIVPLPGREHFTTPPDSESPWRVGYHGTRAHLADIQHISPALAQLHDVRDDVTFEVMLGTHLPDALNGLERLTAPSPLPWQAFREYQRENRLHIGLAPLLETPFNRGKSFIKFLDIAAMGAVGVYSRRSPYTDLVEHGVNGLLAGDDPSEWRDALAWLLDHPDKAAAMAANAAETARRVGDVQLAAAFWNKLH
ncbi:glycosyltransferase family protein [Halomonas urumqiensis]|uniref:Glycosyltransferase family 1 protein n=1 Tax=Halomonas urumqiensis TaxID=1684789 RepID=A0A2N7UCH0_9GAMM|nr:glycosyltransferase [Halomonas urumqiensis]PMR78139.1 hypothetical protein C1H70_15295 [Halomonas urumqiensis]PTB03289.1 glycosyltransferase family 1 protein [Halomonas urumqiensis]GHE20550.1 hypothetical protein GCM10017767_10710 [Halomonas urumqiensis]